MSYVINPLIVSSSSAITHCVQELSPLYALQLAEMLVWFDSAVNLFPISSLCSASTDTSLSEHQSLTWLILFMVRGRRSVGTRFYRSGHCYLLTWIQRYSMPCDCTLCALLIWDIASDVMFSFRLARALCIESVIVERNVQLMRLYCRIVSSLFLFYSNSNTLILQVEVKVVI